VRSPETKCLDWLALLFCGWTWYHGATGAVLTTLSKAVLTGQIVMQVLSKYAKIVGMTLLYQWNFRCGMRSLTSISICLNLSAWNRAYNLHMHTLMLKNPAAAKQSWPVVPNTIDSLPLSRLLL